MPWASVTGRADVTRLSRIQNDDARENLSLGRVELGDDAEPPNVIAICGFTGITRVAATSAIALRTTTPVMYALRSLGIDRLLAAIHTGESTFGRSAGR